MEHLEGQDQYDCEKCKSKQNATKKFTIETLPEVYLIKLNDYRFCVYTLNDSSTLVTLDQKLIHM